jgi:hypothetical protein
MQQWIRDYVNAQKAALDSIPVEAVAKLIDIFRQALRKTVRYLCLATAGALPTPRIL